MNCQIIIICSSEERKENTQKMIELADISNISIHYLEASMLHNSSEFLSNLPDKVSENDKKIFCCVKSHLRAVEYACNDSSPDFSLILEDDVTFYKYNFIEKLNELIKIWSDYKYDHYGMCSIGWIPRAYYEAYLKENMVSFDKLTNYQDSKIICNIFPLGLQGYIINKNKITTKLHNIFDSKTMIEYMTNTTEYLGIDYIDKIGAIFPYAIDHILPRLLTPLVVFPPLIIERNEDSLLGHKNKEKYWDKFFENHQDILEKYIHL